MGETWKAQRTISLGTGLVTVGDFIRVFRERGLHNIAEEARLILGQPAFVAVTEEIKVGLAIVSAIDLGLKGGVTRGAIYRRAQECGLRLCPPEVGPQLRLQYDDQPMCERLPIGMEPIALPIGDLRVFMVGRGVEEGPGGLCLWATLGAPDVLWCGSRRWVFCLPP